MWLGKKDGIDNILMHTCSWRVGDDDIGTSVLLDKVTVEDIFHVASEEEGIVDVVDL